MNVLECRSHLPLAAPVSNLWKLMIWKFLSRWMVEKSYLLGQFDIPHLTNEILVNQDNKVNIQENTIRIFWGTYLFGKTAAFPANTTWMSSSDTLKDLPTCFRSKQSRNGRKDLIICSNWRAGDLISWSESITALKSTIWVSSIRSFEEPRREAQQTHYVTICLSHNKPSISLWHLKLQG